MITLKDAKLNKYYKISHILGDNLKVVRRFLELGLVGGQKVRIVNKSILKKVYLIEIRGYLLSIKTSLLNYIILEGDVV